MRRFDCILLSLAVASCERASARPLGPPARLVAGRADTIVVNSRSAVTLPVQLLDAAGRGLPARALRFERVAGDSLALTPNGRITCDRRGDAEVLVSLGALSTRFALRCRPIKEFRFIYGDGRPLVSAARRASCSSSPSAWTTCRSGCSPARCRSSTAAWPSCEV
jgi:hypothetical protein